MKSYLLWTEDKLKCLSKTKGISNLFTEINSSGTVVRGLDLTRPKTLSTAFLPLKMNEEYLI